MTPIETQGAEINALVQQVRAILAEASNASTQAIVLADVMALLLSLTPPEQRQPNLDTWIALVHRLAEGYAHDRERLLTQRDQRLSKQRRQLTENNRRLAELRLHAKKMSRHVH